MKSDILFPADQEPFISEIASSFDVLQKLTVSCCQEPLGTGQILDVYCVALHLLDTVLNYSFLPVPP